MSAVVLGEVAALGAAFCWAVAPILYRQALFKTHPISANIVRCASNAVVMLLVLVALGKWNVLASLPLNVAVLVATSGIIGLGVGDTLYMLSLKAVGVSLAVPLAASYPLFSLVWATFLLGQPVTASAVAGAVLILAGIWLLCKEKPEAVGGVNRRWLFSGVAAGLATAVFWSVSITLMDSALNSPGVVGMDANYAIITLRIASMAMFLLLLAPILDKGKGFLKMNRRTVLQLCVGGLVANAVGWFLMNYSFVNIPEAQAVPVSSVTPLFSAAAGFLLFKEKATWNRVLGALVVVLGVVLIFLV
jgi:drug/metabolite transporter (DMT)-like permease